MRVISSCGAVTAGCMPPMESNGQAVLFGDAVVDRMDLIWPGHHRAVQPSRVAGLTRFCSQTGRRAVRKNRYAAGILAQMRQGLRGYLVGKNVGVDIEDLHGAHSCRSELMVCDSR